MLREYHIEDGEGVDVAMQGRYHMPGNGQRESEEVGSSDYGFLKQGQLVYQEGNKGKKKGLDLPGDNLRLLLAPSFLLARCARVSTATRASYLCLNSAVRRFRASCKAEIS